MAASRAALSALSSAGLIGINPDQRMHEDTRHLCELSSDLAIGCFQASILLVTFLSVLWVRSGVLPFQIFGLSIGFPGYMVWAAVIYSGSASISATGRGVRSSRKMRSATDAKRRFAFPSCASTSISTPSRSAAVKATSKGASNAISNPYWRSCAISSPA